MSDERFWTFFFELFETLPRQGPGLDAFTDKALGCLPPLTADRRILDIGCGTGMQTLELARRCEAEILATDLHAPFLDILKRNAEREGLGGCIEAQVADMSDLPFEDRSFDVLWAEGSIFIIGFARGLASWRRLLKPDGHLVVSELTFFEEDIPAELREVCFPDSDEDAGLEGRRRAISEAGYTLLDEFPLPREGWWEAFYLPVLERLDAFERRHAGQPEAQAVVDRFRHEIDVFERYSDLYGYTFFVMKR